MTNDTGDKKTEFATHKLWRFEMKASTIRNVRTMMMIAQLIIAWIATVVVAAIHT